MRDLLNKLTLFESTQEGFDPEEFKGEIEDFEVSGDDGEPEGADIHYTAKIVDGKPVVDPKSIEVHAYGNNPSSKLGYDVQNDTDMIMNYGGVDAEEILRSAQEDAEEQYAERDNKYSQGENVGENSSEVSNEMYGMISDLVEKFSKFRGGNGDRLPDGYIQWALNSGITTDFVEENEAEAMREKYGEEEFENDPLGHVDEMPITKAFLDEIEKITGDDDIDTNARIIDKVQSGDADESTNEGAFDKADRITDPVELNLYGPEDIENNSQLSAEELKDELEGDIYHLMDKASDDFTDNDHIADEMGDHFANMHLKADDKTLSCYIAMRDLIDADPADVYETGKKCLKILGAQEHQDQEQGNKGPKGRPAADAYAGGMESTNDELARIKELAGASIDETYDDDDAFYEAYGEMWYNEDDIVDEAEYQGRKVKLGKPMQGDVKKFKVYVKDPKTGNVKKVNFGHGGSSVKGKAMSIKKSNPKRRKSFRARHNCDNPGPRTKARYWSCRKW